MTPKEMERLDSIISLTEDNELQSELWILLSDQPNLSPSRALEIIVNRSMVEEAAFKAFKSLIVRPMKEHTVIFIESLAPVERSVVTMAMFGLSSFDIREYKSLSPIRYAQVLSSVMSSKTWEKYLEEEAKLRRKKRTGSTTCSSG